MPMELSSHDVPVDVVKPHPKNARRGDIELIKQSLERFGQVRPILVNKDKVVIAGNHTFRAIKDLGWKFVSIVQVDFSPEDERAYLLADNKTADAASWDDDALIESLEYLATNSTLDGTGFTADDLDDLVGALEEHSYTEIEPFEGDYAEPPEATAERWEGRNEGQNREVVFLLPNEDYEEFVAAITKLKMKYATESMARAVYEAVYREAHHVASAKYLAGKQR
jgi:ParB-like chromosome segregation protein Spo0J